MTWRGGCQGREEEGGTSGTWRSGTSVTRRGGWDLSDVERGDLSDVERGWDLSDMEGRPQ